jgi:hypothetical protein
MERAKEVALEPNLRIQVVTAQDFIGAKLEAIRGRGQGGHANSHDVEDLLAVIDGREAIVGEIADANADLRSYIAEQFRVLLKTAAHVAACSQRLKSRFAVISSPRTESARTNLACRLFVATLLSRGTTAQR